jgi:hypothetical protein
MTVAVHTQQELYPALADNAEKIYIESPSGLYLQLLIRVPAAWWLGQQPLEATS